MKSAKPAGVICSGVAISEPVAMSLPAASVPAPSPAAIVSCSLARCSRGVLAGATMPMKLRARKPLTPCSSNVGMSGALFERAAPATPTMCAVPALQRATTQPQARALYDRHSGAAGLKWWSAYEALWMNVTVFERAADRLRLVSVRPLTIEDPAVVEAADFFGLRTVA
jgi:hypothetical protein